MVNNFYAFANDPGANVVSQAAYDLLTTLRADGFTSGIALSEQFNKVWRQGSIGTYLIGQLIVDLTGQDALDDGDLATLLANFKAAISAQAATTEASRIITSSADTTLTADDRAVGFNRTSALAPTIVTLTTPDEGVVVTIQDLVGNFNAYPVTVTPPVGMTLAGLSTFVMNVNRQSAAFRYYGSNLWGIQQ